MHKTIQDCVKHVRSFLLSVLIFFNSLLISGQSKILISRPELSYINNTLIVKYNITGCRTGQSVNISMIVLNSKGDTLRPSNITGDIGKMINCGLGKSITWDVAGDNIKINDDIEVVLLGKESFPVISNIKPQGTPMFTRGKVMISSFFVPGLGQTMASGKGCYLLFSGLAYGAAGASAYFFVKHGKYYTDYKNTSGAEADAYFSKAEESFNMGRYLLFGAGGAWVTNFIWSAVMPIRDKPLKKPALGIAVSQGNGLLLSARWTF